MRVSSIDIQGFKSFAKKTRIDLTDGITAVIGPNGSGKSCVVDAVRWVLGEQSVKQLRGKVSTDIIFHGSETIPAARKAEVTVTFDNESGKFPLQTATVAITRQLTSKGDSRYLLNGEDVRLLDLQHMLAQAGVGTKTFTFISQGMVDKYVTASPQVRKELFDDATGIKPLQLKLIEAHRKLKKTQEHAGELETTLRELGPRLKVLARQIKRYAEREELVKTFSQKQRSWFSHAWRSLEERIQSLSEEEDRLHTVIKTARSRREAIEQELLSGSHTRSRSLEDEVARAQIEFTTAQTAYAKREEEYMALQNLIQQAEKEHAAAVAKTTDTLTTPTSRTWLEVVSRALEVGDTILRRLSEDRSALTSEDINKALDVIHQGQEAIKDSSPEMLITQAANTVAGPAAELARVEAILEERRRQLAGITRLTPPSDTHLKELVARLKTHPTNRNTLPQELAAARDEELVAERSASASSTALEQARLELHQLEETVLREQGSETLTMLKKGEVEGGIMAEPPTEEELRRLATKLAALGEPDPLVLREYEEVRQRHTHLQRQYEDIRSAANNIVDMMGDLHTQMQRQFAEKFTVIRDAFSRAFAELFDGGSATLSLSENGIEISVTPPGKRSRHIGLLSGGERALTSLALLMGILEAQSPPFIVLDEVDAALDEANSQRFAQLLRKYCTTTQCIVVTHNRAAMGAADVLYGVTMQQKGVSSVYSVKLSDISEAEVGEGHHTMSV